MLFNSIVKPTARVTDLIEKDQSPEAKNDLFKIKPNGNLYNNYNSLDSTGLVNPVNSHNHSNIPLILPSLKSAKLQAEFLFPLTQTSNPFNSTQFGSALPLDFANQHNNFTKNCFNVNSDKTKFWKNYLQTAAVFMHSQNANTSKI